MGNCSRRFRIDIVVSSDNTPTPAVPQVEPDESEGFELIPETPPTPVLKHKACSTCTRDFRVYVVTRNRPSNQWTGIVYGDTCVGAFPHSTWQLVLTQVRVRVRRANSLEEALATWNQLFENTTRVDHHPPSRRVWRCAVCQSPHY
jgi:hypothetical protein